MTKEEIMEGLKQILSDVKPKLDLSKVNMETALSSEMGIDSLSMLLMSLAIENKFGFQFSSQEIFQTVGQVVDCIYKAKN